MARNSLWCIKCLFILREPRGTPSGWDALDLRCSLKRSAFSQQHRWAHHLAMASCSWGQTSEGPIDTILYVVTAWQTAPALPHHIWNTWITFLCHCHGPYLKRSIHIHPQRGQSILSILQLYCKQTFMSKSKKEVFLCFDIFLEWEK